MTLIEQLRLMIGDPDPGEFTDIQLQFYLDERNSDLNRTASFIWGLKASGSLGKLSSLKATKSKVGSQSFEYSTVAEAYKLALEMKNYYTGLASTSSIVIKNRARPDVFKGLAGEYNGV
jgi:hypothetical protein